MRIEQSIQGAVTVVRPKGPLVKEDAEAFRHAILERIHETVGRLVIDLSGVTFVDSLGLEALAAAGAGLADGGRTLKLSGLNETLREVLELTDIASAFDLHEDVNAAVRSFN